MKTVITSIVESTTKPLYANEALSEIDIRQKIQDMIMEYGDNNTISTDDDIVGLADSVKVAFEQNRALSAEAAGDSAEYDAIDAEYTDVIAQLNDLDSNQLVLVKYHPMGAFTLVTDLYEIAEWFDIEEDFDEED